MTLNRAGLHRAFIGIGSNIAPTRNIRRACELLSQTTRIRAISTFSRTAPLERPGQDYFINGVVAVDTELDARRLKFDVLRKIERQLGRRRSSDRFAPRTIDLDILLFDNAIIRDHDLVIPDPDIWERPFLAMALLELQPDLVPPDRRRPLANAPCLQQQVQYMPELEFTSELRKEFCHE